MRYLLIIIVSFVLIIPAYTQVNWEKYESIASLSGSDHKDLAQSITDNFETEEDKAQAIYYWVTHNIKYDMKLFEKVKKSKGDKKKYSKQEIKEKELKEVKKTLKSKKGICQQYSRVFQYLCEAVGIQCTYIGGYAKSDPTKSGLGGKHAWNAVDIDDNWHLVDATFGAGYTDDKKKFHFKFDEVYFGANPEAFKMNHLPSQSKWQLSDEIMEKETYKKNTGIGSGYFKHELNMVLPEVHKVTAERGVPLVISFNSPKELKSLNVANMRKAKELAATFTKEGDRYTLIVNTDELKSGTYGFFEDKDLLFVYRISVN